MGILNFFKTEEQTTVKKFQVKYIDGELKGFNNRVYCDVELTETDFVIKNKATGLTVSLDRNKITFIEIFEKGGSYLMKKGLSVIDENRYFVITYNQNGQSKNLDFMCNGVISSVYKLRNIIMNGLNLSDYRI